MYRTFPPWLVFQSPSHIHAPLGYVVGLKSGRTYVCRNPEVPDEPDEPEVPLPPEAPAKFIVQLEYGPEPDLEYAATVIAPVVALYDVTVAFIYVAT